MTNDFGQYVPEYSSALRGNILEIPKIISQCSGIRIFGRVIKSVVFSTDVAVIRNVNADAIIAIYPFTPQPVITHSLMIAADLPVFCGVGGGLTAGPRVIQLASDAEFQGAMGIVLNSPTSNDIIKAVREVIDVPIVITVVSEHEDVSKRYESGASIFNISAASRTPWVVEHVRKAIPNMPIMATGGPSDQSIRDTINAGANAITWTPPTTGELFKSKMQTYRQYVTEEKAD